MAEIIRWGNSNGYTIKLTQWELTTLYSAVDQALRKYGRKTTGHSLDDAHFDIEVIAKKDTK